MNIDLQRRYDSSDDFFSLGGSVVMKLSADAAIAVCERAGQHGLVVARIEGGIWHFPGFEARLDCIWDGIDPPVDVGVAEQNNLAAAEFVRSESQEHDVFVVTAPEITGW
ncbi:toxin-immunity protein system imunity protein CdiI [Burkholderia pseudomallei]|uniref:Immunity protein CdiI n=2 Tax=Burkholderia pseudomallei TaxID=28450 RepID=CDII8_BURPE|nr:toxin-immunity protein system imunity protein CdiI [Burkholderia pseudomallei]H9T8I0.1 RecName: Full=Immunity protein CdiI [Burkholderia pseudomallei]AFG17279.1 CdiI [Burkholderia pseudomallei]AFG17289.1 CdiI [Burkholderia pseudomallei]AFG17294.1 CdiI [Burkholderia pseudomallei]ARK45510.1 colicin immunity protein [Burkholderia pseudomallei]ARK59548.1 colicin immunity protein [Burkholderia pseudomallei]